MCNLTSGGTTTQTNALPDWAANSVQSGLQGALSTYQGSNFAYYPGQLAASADPSMYQAMGTTSAGTGYTAPTVTAGSIPTTNLSSYENPYTQSVVDTTNSDINRQLAQQEQTNNGQAALSGAFGGDRAAITNTQSQYNANQLLAQTDAGLNQSNFTNAEQMATSDLNRGLQAQTANMQGSLAGNQQQQAAASQLYNEGSGLTALQQNSDTLSNQQYRLAQQYPIEMAQLGTQAISQDSGALGDELMRQTVAPNASALGTAAGLTTTAAGLAGLLGGSSASSSGLLGLLGLGGSAATSAASSGGLWDGATSGYGGDSGGLWDDVSFARGGRIGYADGGLVDDPGYVPVAATDGMLTMDQQGNLVTPYDERLGLRYGTTGGLMPMPSTSAATSDGAGWSSDQSGNGGLGLEAARIGSFADGGAVDTSDLAGYGPDGSPVYLPASGLAAAVPQGSGVQVSANGLSDQPPASLTGYADFDQAMTVPPDGSPAVAAAPADVSAGAPDPAAAAAPDAPTGLAAAVPGQVPYQTNLPEGPDDPSLPVPPIPPAATPDDRLAQSADPAAALPGGQTAPTGIAAAAPQPPPMAPQQGSSPAGMQGQPQTGQGGSNWALPVLAAGLGMLSNASPNAGKMIGGGLAGVQTLMQGREMDMRRLQLQQQMNYQNGMLGIRGGQVGVSQQRADQQGAYQQGQLANGADRNAVRQQQVTQQGAYQQGQLDNGAQRIGVAQQRADQQGAYQQGQLDNSADRNGIAQQRADQQNDIAQQNQVLQQQKLQALQGNRAQQLQAHASDEEDKGARSIMYAAAQGGKIVPYAAALQQVRQTRLSAGPAPVQGMGATPMGSGAPPASQGATPAISEGATATGPNGARVIFHGGQWQPLN